MSENDPIDESLLRWEEERQRGNHLTEHDLCPDDPQLAERIRQRIEAIQAMEHILGVPTKNKVPPTIASELTVPQIPTPNLPVVPGYDVLRVVEEGGMGVVYQARQHELERIVAIKMISGVRLAPKFIARFRREAMAVAQLQHPNIVELFEAGQVESRPFYSMEFVAGGSLAERILECRLTPHESASLLETIARAVQTAHEQNIVHRDLKPSNVLMTEEGIPKITDFGLAKRLDDDSGHTQTGEILGTPSYMAPEQAEGRRGEVGPLTDVFALGAILYELLTGQPPFKGATALETLHSVVHLEPIPPRQLDASLPRDLEAICLKCLEKKPSDRYPSALAFAEDLHRFGQGLPAGPRQAGYVSRLWRTVRRHPQATFALLLVVLSAAWPVLSAISDYREERHRRVIAERRAPQVREILKRGCYECHGEDPDTTEKDLDVLNHRQLLDSERKLVVPGDPDHSRLLQRIADGSMPPEEDELHLPRITEKELTILKEWILGGAPPLPAEDPANPTPSVEPYSPLAAKVKTIFVKRCYECHKYDVARGGIKILHHRLLLSIRKVVVPGDPDASELYQLLIADDPENRMPPESEAPLPADEIRTIREWIRQGAPSFPKSE